ncbi:MAG TPA: SpoIIE family protein phosphatase [Methylomirabilota bacterium]|nr:SpoIIE family protein phosphatase [Methylomirabilota bacterium]
MKPVLRVLIVEDSEFDAQMITSLVRKSGYEVVSERVETSDAMEKTLRQKPWDIVLSDYNLPAFSAPEALKLLQGSELDLPFIIISGGIGEATAVAAMKAGAHDYLMKGNLNRLAPAIERELREAANRRERREAREKLLESELRYRMLWESSPDAVLLMDAESKIHFANPAVETVFGYKQEEIVGQELRVLLPAELRSNEARPIENYLRTGEKLTLARMVETVGRRKDGHEIVIEVSFSHMELHGERRHVAFIRDITARKRTERALRENQEQLQVAREIQQRLFPKSAPALEGFDIAGVTYPAEETGGDYFDYLQMLNGNVGVIVADVTGHGIGPALLMAETRAYLRTLAANRDDIGEILTTANRILAEDIGEERFVTLFLGKIDPKSRLFSYASAGHPTGYVLGHGGEIKTLLKRTAVPLGIDPTAKYEGAVQVGLQPGDTVLLLTDGIEETMAPDESFFGIERTLNVVRQNREKPAREVLDALYRSVRDFAQHTPQLDDVTAIVIKVL